MLLCEKHSPIVGQEHFLGNRGEPGKAAAKGQLNPVLNPLSPTTPALQPSRNQTVARPPLPAAENLPGESFVPSGQPRLVETKVDPKTEKPAPVVAEKASAPPPPPAVLAQLEASPTPPGGEIPFAQRLALGAGLATLSPYQSPHPAYEHYNVPPACYASCQAVRQAMRGEVQDVRANSYSLGTYLGNEAQKEGIVAQQVLEVLNTVRHFSGDSAGLEQQLKKGLNMSGGRAQELSRLAGALEPFRNLKSFAEVGQDTTMLAAVTTLVESSHNWGPQPEDFKGSGAIVAKLLNNPAFTRFLDKEVLNAKQEKKPPVGVVLRNLGYSEGVSNTLQEASMGVQAVDRLLFTPKNAADLVPIGNIAGSPPPFPKQIADKIEPYAKDIQLAVKLNLAVINGLNSGQVQLDRAEFDENRLRLAYLSAGELSAVLSAEKQSSSAARQEKIQATIDQLQLKRQAIEAELGAEKLQDLQGPDPRQLMKPLLQKSRAFFEAAVPEAARERSLAWVQEFAELTSLKH